MTMRKAIALSLALSLPLVTAGLAIGLVSKPAPAPFVPYALIWIEAGQESVMDYRLTGDDCLAELESMASPHAYCTILPPCAYEDSPRCYWDATTRGNGRGNSFINLESEE